MECHSGVLEAVGRRRPTMRRLARTCVRIGGVTLDPVFCHVAMQDELVVGRGVDLFVHHFLFLRRTILGVRRHDTGEVTAVSNWLVAGWVLTHAIFVLVCFIPGALVGTLLAAVACHAAGSCRTVVTDATLVVVMLLPVVEAVLLVHGTRAVRHLRPRPAPLASMPFPVDL